MANYIKSLIVLLVISVFMFGCKVDTPSVKLTNVPEPENDISNHISESAKVVSDASNSDSKIVQDVSDIKKAVSDGITITPSQIKSQFDGIWQKITSKTDDILANINIITKDLMLIKSFDDRLTITQKEVIDIKNQLKSENGRAEAEKALRLKAEEGANQALKEKYIWISIVCFSGMLLSGALALSGWGNSKLTFGIAIVCAVGLGLSIFLIQILNFMPYIIGGIILIVIGLIVWQIYEKNKTIATNEKTDATKDTAILELIKTTEAVKTFLTDVARKEMFGQGPVPGKVSTIQSDSTEAIVSQVRDNIDKAPPAITTTTLTSTPAIPATLTTSTTTT
jgi:flagellar basal body-associated protein FliL